MRKSLLVFLFIIALILPVAMACAGPLARIYIAPQDAGLAVGASLNYKVIGEDADGNEVAVPQPVTWTTNPVAGSINTSGIFTAGTAPGRYRGAVTATVTGGFTSTANIEVYSNEIRNGYIIERSLGSLYGGQLNDPAAVAVDRAGYIYVLSRTTNTINRFDASGRFLSGFKLNETFSGKVQMTVDMNLNIYILDCANCRVLKYDASGGYIIQWGMPGSGNGQFNQPTDIAVDWSGQVYINDKENSRVQAFSSAGSYISSWTFKDKYNVNMQPLALAIDAYNNLWVAAFSWNGPSCVVKLDVKGRELARVEVPYLEYGCDDMAVVADENIYMMRDGLIKLDISEYSPTFWCYIGEYYWGHFGHEIGMYDSPEGIAVDNSGMIYVADSGNNRIQIFDPSGINTSTWASAGMLKGQLNTPATVVTDSQGKIYVADTENFRIQQFDSTCGIINEMSSKRDKDSPFSCPAGLTLDTQGNIFTSDILNNRILSYDSAGILRSNWTLTDPSVLLMGVAFGSGGYIYSVDGYNNLVRKFDSGGNIVRTWGQPGPGNGQFNTPTGTAVDSSGNIVVSDYGNNRVQKFNSSGTFLAKWGTAGIGIGQFAGPAGLCFDSSNYLFVADRNNCRIQKLNTAGTYVSQLGKEGYGKWEFLYPEGVFINSQGQLFVADSSNHRIMKYIPNPGRPISVTITSPVNADTYTATTSTINISGTSSGTINSITWSNDRGGSGTCTGTGAWSASGIALSPGQNVVSVKVTNTAGLVVTDSLIVTYLPALESTPPAINITGPTSNPTYTSQASAISLAGTASDNQAVTSVTWSNNLGGNGTCTGTTSWSASQIPLMRGDNIITVIARDAAGNVAIDTLTVTYGDGTPPVVTITSPTTDPGYAVQATGLLSLFIYGTATDNVGITEMTWHNGYANSGTIPLGSPWMAAVKVSPGRNYITIHAKDAYGNAGFDTIVVYYSPIKYNTVAELKKNTSYHTGSDAYVSGAVVTAIFPDPVNGDLVYIEDPERQSGIAVECMVNPVNVAVGSRVKAAGYTSRFVPELSRHERAMEGVINFIGSGPTIQPLGMSCRSLGGGDWFFGDIWDEAGQSGVTGGTGLNNIGLLVRTWGKVMQVGTNYMYIDDGSNLRDGSFTGSQENVGVRVKCNPAGYSVGDYVSVTGLSSMYEAWTIDDEVRARCILTRSAGDIQKITKP